MEFEKAQQFNKMFVKGARYDELFIVILKLFRLYLQL
jgi:hypothetical protein